ncbi:hypothetical protein I79_017105 [Cricetulus griseus]|uniref:Uncharacterized protein n=1 Tax=Cricetulus griseus TaxID=10029 RepID=G3I159_CRIGR|nr:hypothetical protein I79_017105 [Cricetulus griseus]
MELPGARSPEPGARSPEPGLRRVLGSEELGSAGVGWSGGHDWGNVDLKSRIPLEVPGLTTDPYTRATPE